MSSRRWTLTSYTGGTMGIDHPNTRCQDYDGGRSWYTGLGHTIDSFSEQNFLKMILGGIETTAGAVKADCSASVDGSFQKVTLDDNTSNPMMLDVARDGRVLYIDIKGDVKVIKPEGGTVLSGPSMCSPPTRAGCSVWRWTRTSPPTTG